MIEREIRIWMEDPRDDLTTDERRKIEREIKDILERMDMVGIDMEFSTWGGGYP